MGRRIKLEGRKVALERRIYPSHHTVNALSGEYVLGTPSSRSPLLAGKPRK